MTQNSVLIVEDDVYFSILLAEVFTDIGFEVVKCSSPDKALKLCEKRNFSLWLIDAMLPNVSSTSGISDEEARGGFQTGIAVLRRLRSKYTKTPSIVITGYPNAEIQKWCRETGAQYLIKPFNRVTLIENVNKLLDIKAPVRQPLCFIVHGHDEDTLRNLKDFINENLKFPQPVILKEERSTGRTIIESLEFYGNQVDIAFVILTPDDILCDPKDNDEVKRQARQNVIFELGFFYGLLGRLSGKVILLHRGPIDLPGDISGIIYIDISKGISAAADRICKELSFWLS
jgi:DNA-binding response OmpR family regulator